MRYFENEVNGVGVTIQPLHTTNSHILNIFIHGFFGLDKNIDIDEFRAIALQFPKMNSVLIHWDSKSLHEIIDSDECIENKRTSSSVSELLINSAAEMSEVFMKGQKNADRLAQSIEEIIYLSLENQRFTTLNIFAHSLGGRIVVNGLKHLNKNTLHLIDNIILMGAAVAFPKERLKITNNKTKIYNLYSKNDCILPVKPDGEKCIGRNPILEKYLNIYNIPCPKTGHTDYWKKLPQFLTANNLEITMSQLTNYLAQAEHFFNDCNDEQAKTVLDDIRIVNESFDFRICVAGGFSKGKTHFVNQLLEIELFPEAAPPTTTLLTEIRYGYDPSMQFEDEKKNTTHTLLNAEELEKFTADGEFADATGVLSVKLPTEFLLSSKVIYDTPGVDDVFEQRANVTFKALEACDAAIIAVSAVAPLSLTEKAFIDTYLYEKAIPNVALLITFLDKLPSKSITEQMAHITNKARTFYPNIEIWTTYEDVELPSNTIQPVVGLEAIKKRIHEWSTLPSIVQLRQKRDLLRIRDTAEMTVSRQKVMLDNLQGDINLKLETLNQAFDALDEDNDYWRGIRGKFVGKSTDTVDFLQNKVQFIAQSLVSRIGNERIADIKASLPTELLKAKKELSTILQEKIEKDIQELPKALENKFNVETSQVFYSIENMADSTGSVNQKSFINGIVDKVLNANPAIFSLIIGKLLSHPAIAQFKPLVMLATPFVEKWFDDLRNYWDERTHQQNTDELIERIDAFCSQMHVEMNDVIGAIYTKIADELRKAQQEWVNTQREELHHIHNVDDLQNEIARTSDAIERGLSLIGSLDAAMEE